MDPHFRHIRHRLSQRLSERAAEARKQLSALLHHQPERAILLRKISWLLSLGCISTLLGATAHHQSQAEALSSWKAQNTPSRSFIASALKTLQFRPIHSTQELQSLLRKHPGRWAEVGELWFAQVKGRDESETRWITLLTPGNDGARSEVVAFVSTNACPPEERTPKANVSSRKRRSTRLKTKFTSSNAERSSPESPEEASHITLKAHQRPETKDWRPAGQGWEALQWVSQLEPLPSGTKCENTPSTRKARASRTSFYDPRALRY
jgi:hypothetical protein